MNITVICVGKLKEKYLKEAVSEYSKRLSRFVKLEIIELPDCKIPDNASPAQEADVLEKEGDMILSKIKQNSYIVAMCIEGNQLSSTEFAKKLENISMQSSNIVFIIGGSLGLSDKVKKTASMHLSFGKITLPHQLMRVILLEQVYRGYKINNNETYHK